MKRWRAVEICRAMEGIVAHAMGLRKDCPDISSYSLREMLTATRMLEAEPGPPSTCDDRLIAAIYTWAHYDPQPTGKGLEAIVIGRGRALCCVAVEQGDG